MHRLEKVLAVAFTLMALAATGLAVAQHAHEEPAEAAGHGAHEGQLTVRGEVLDMACFLAHEAKGPDHASCAQRCVKGGQPMGLLAEDGTVYLLYANHDDGAAFEAAKEFAGRKVEIDGVASSQSGIRGLEVAAVRPL